jgi:hypothetical protein
VLALIVSQVRHKLTAVHIAPLGDKGTVAGALDQLLQAHDRLQLKFGGERTYWHCHKRSGKKMPSNQTIFHSRSIGALGGVSGELQLRRRSGDVLLDVKKREAGVADMKAIAAFFGVSKMLARFQYRYP